MSVEHVLSIASRQTQVPPLCVKIEACKVSEGSGYGGIGTNIDCYDIRHRKECCKSSPNLGEELGAFPLLRLQMVSDAMPLDPRTSTHMARSIESKYSAKC